MKRLAHAAMITLMAGIGMTQASAQGTKTLEVIVFPGGFNWPIFVGQDKGFFEKNGVDGEGRADAELAVPAQGIDRGQVRHRDDRDGQRHRL